MKVECREDVGTSSERRKKFLCHMNHYPTYSQVKEVVICSGGKFFTEIII